MTRFNPRGYILVVFSVCLLLTAIQPLYSQKNSSAYGPITIVVHGGAGTIRKVNMSEEMESAYREKLTEAIDKGYSILKNGGTSVEAVENTIVILENSPLFNAGKGAVFTHEGTNELDASVMEGKNLNAGAVAGVRIIKNPIRAAIAVMDQSPHVLLSGEGAEKFAVEKGLEIVKPEYFYTERRYRSLQRILEEEGGSQYNDKENKFGTVGVVALDKFGNLAAGTSTGGMTNKKFGRIGDSPIIGAGTYADNQSCAVSSTGHGEYFIRNVVAYDISARMKYKGMSLENAAREAIKVDLKEKGGSGGIIALDRNGNIAMVFNTEGMYRGYRKKGEKARVYIYAND